MHIELKTPIKSIKIIKERAKITHKYLTSSSKQIRTKKNAERVNLETELYIKITDRSGWTSHAFDGAIE